MYKFSRTDAEVTKVHKQIVVMSPIVVLQHELAFVTKSDQLCNNANTKLTLLFSHTATIIVHDFHPTAQTLMERHFTSVAQEQESYLWNYVIQLSVALFNVHTKQLHCRGCVNMNKIIVCDCLR